MIAAFAGGTANKRYTIDVSDYVKNVLNGRTDSKTRAAFAIVRLFRYNAAGGGTFGYPSDSLGSNQVVSAATVSSRLGLWVWRRVKPAPSWSPLRRSGNAHRHEVQIWLVGPKLMHEVGSLITMCAE